MSDERIIKQLSGFSGSSVYLIEDDTKTFVRKINNVDRNYERLNYLHKFGFPVPKIYRKHNNILDIEYIASLDIKSYLKFNSINLLLDFLLEILDSLSKNKEQKDYYDVYCDKLEIIDFSKLPFSRKQLLNKLPRILYKSDYFGDLTLENILYGNDHKFHLIDCSTIEYDSYIFDIAKLRQDLTCKWFLRNDSISLDVKLREIEKVILSKYPESNNDYILILMLLRVYVHSVDSSFEQKFLLREIYKLWK